MSLDSFARRIDARFNLPRRADSQHHSSYRACINVLGAFLESTVVAICGIASVVLLWLIGGWLVLSTEMWLVVALVMGVVIVLAFAEATDVWLSFNRFFSRETYGDARWATRADLKDAGLVRPKTEESFAPGDRFWYLAWRALRWTREKYEPDPRLPPAIRIGSFDFFHDLVMSVEEFANHLEFFGPPKSGKSASFFMSVARQWARFGSAILLDTKRELFKYTARYYRETYLLDLINPAYSDRLGFMAACKGDAEYASAVANIIVGLNNNRHTPQNNENKFWREAATALLKSMLLYVSSITERPHPAMILEFIAAREVTREKGEVVFDSLDEALGGARDKDVRQAYGIFRQQDERLKASVIISMTTILEAFSTPHAMSVLSPPTKEERDAGVREIDMNALRRRGHAVYVVVPEGEASRLQPVLSTIFGLASLYLRKTGDPDDAAYCLIQMDEAGNVPPPSLSEDVNVGRGRKMCYMLGYQNKRQPDKQMGEAEADTVNESIGATFFLPGCKAKTARYAVELLGKTTTLQKSNTDAVDDRIDNERLTEIGRQMMDETSVRQMLRHVQAIAIIGTAPPIRFMFPPDAKVVDRRKTLPTRRVIAAPPLLLPSPTSQQQQSLTPPTSSPPTATRDRVDREDESVDVSGEREASHEAKPRRARRARIVRIENVEQTDLVEVAAGGE
ncbi:MAG: type IV secretory system conjugative DNA transfer family protein [Pyrinomonadaceae bacterium]|nr:type IV secretory system conjugative DNA transfer family protein [Pyrinomonadaceae bacterium]